MRGGIEAIPISEAPASLADAIASIEKATGVRGVRRASRLLAAAAPSPHRVPPGAGRCGIECEPPGGARTPGARARDRAH